MKAACVLALLGLLASGCAVGSQLERGEDEPGDPGGSPRLDLHWSCPSSSPVVRQLALDAWASYALLDDGSLWCWGRCWPDATSGPGKMDQTTPRPVRVALDGVARVAAGSNHACAALEDGTVHCWGPNFHGQAGEASHSVWTIDAPSHIAIEDVIDLNLGGPESCALRADGTVACWGLPYVFFPYGLALPAGVPESGPQSVPVEIPGIEPGGRQIKGGFQTHCVRGSAGRLQCFAGFPLPDLSGETLPVRTFAASQNQICLVYVTGQARCYFRLIVGDPPVAVPAWNGATEIALSRQGSHACALTGGLVRCAGGGGGAGQTLPELYSIPEDLPPVPGLFHTTHIAIGNWHGCAVDSGCVRCWGRNDEGQLGDGTYQSSTAPTFVKWE